MNTLNETVLPIQPTGDIADLIKRFQEQQSVLNQLLADTGAMADEVQRALPAAGGNYIKPSTLP
jgi:hypothetical protein